MDARDPKTGVTGNHVLLGSVLFRRETADAPAFDLTIGRAGSSPASSRPMGRARSSAGSGGRPSCLAGPGRSGPRRLRDGWEKKFFGDTKGVFYSDDPDGDGLDNLAEAELGSDPTDPIRICVC